MKHTNSSNDHWVYSQSVPHSGSAIVIKKFVAYTNSRRLYRSQLGERGMMKFDYDKQYWKGIAYP